jgi:dihydrofolate reductase
VHDITARVAQRVHRAHQLHERGDGEPHSQQIGLTEVEANHWIQPTANLLSVVGRRCRTAAIDSEAKLGKVFFDISMSLDGFMTAANRRPEEPMGDGGLKLVEWAFGQDERDRAVLAGGIAGTGAVIAGRRTYDSSLPWWGADGPTGEARLPVFVLSHSTPGDVPEGGVYTFVDGIERALEEARAAAGDKDVTVMGGAETGRQYIGAGLVDELSIHLVPVLLGSGTRMFEQLGDEHLQFERVDTIQTEAAIHLRLQRIDE